MSATKDIVSKKNIFFFKEVFAGITTSLVVVLFSVAAASLLFSGTLAPLLPIGIGSALVGTCVVNLVTNLKSDFKFAICGVDPTQAVLIAIIIKDITYRVPTAYLPETILISIAFISAVIGLLLLLVGILKVANLIRFIPYPVIGGFTAGTGWLILRSSFKLITRAPQNFLAFFQWQHVIYYFPALFLGAFLLFLNRRYKNILVFPVFIVITIIFIYTVLWLTHTNHQQAIYHGWLFQPVKLQTPITLLHKNFFHQIAWYGSINQLHVFLVLVGFVVLMQLLNMSALEAAILSKVDLNKEIKIAGTANIINSVFLGVLSNIRFTSTILNYYAGSRNQLSGIVVTIICLSILIFKINVLAFIPKLVVIGILFYVSFNFIYEWLYAQRQRLSKSDYAIVLIILATIIFFGLLQGILVGVLFSFLFFVITSSKQNFIKYAITGVTHQSHFRYPAQVERYLHEKGERIRLFKLQGYLFFGTAEKLAETILQSINTENKDQAQYIILDFQFVSAIDSSVVFSISKTINLLHPYFAMLIFCHCNAYVKQQLDKMGFLGKDSKNAVLMFLDADHAVQWCEKQILHDAADFNKKIIIKNIAEQLEALLNHKEQAQILLHYFTKLSFPAKQILFRQGEFSDCLYFIESGRISAYLETANETIIELFTSESGTIVGEIGFFLDTKRTATAIIEKDSIIYKLTQADFKKLSAVHPEIALIFQNTIIRVLAERLIRANSELQLLNK